MWVIVVLTAWQLVIKNVRTWAEVWPLWWFKAPSHWRHAKQRAIDKQRLRLSGERTMALAVSQEPAFFMFLLLTENYITCIYISYFLLQIKPSIRYWFRRWKGWIFIFSTEVQKYRKVIVCWGIKRQKREEQPENIRRWRQIEEFTV